MKAGCPKSPTTPTAAAKQVYTAAPPMSIDTSKTYTATFKTTTGTFVAALDAKSAPQTVNNFVFLANKGYFNCGSFFRVIPGFVLQTGNPRRPTKAKSLDTRSPTSFLPRHRIPGPIPSGIARDGQHGSAQHGW